MIAFSRIAAFVLFVFSLGLLTCAAPTSAKTQDLSVRGGDVAVMANAFVDLEAKVKHYLDICVDLNAEVDVRAKIIEPLIVDIKACTDIIVKVGADIKVDAKVKADIVARIAAIVTLCAKILISLSAKLSVSVIASICAQLDVCLQALLVALNVCIQGVAGLSLKAIVDLTVLVFVKVKLALCADVLGLLKVNASVAPGVSL
ncbi:hypothetical protein FRC11_008047 [Ceratobasidium sp. 423]|nr:hypothetical protein FRC11_008047 [Ceratobasidium sp. 423]